MIIKLVVVALIVYTIYFMLFKKPSAKKRDQKKDVIDSQTMLECKKCGAYVSADEAIIKDGQFYCSKECASLP